MADKVKSKLARIKAGVSEFNTLKNIDENFQNIGDTVDEIIDQIGDVEGDLTDRVDEIESNYVKKKGGTGETSQTIETNIVVKKNATIDGDLTVNGKQTVLNVENLDVKDAFITVNKDGTPLGTNLAGIGILTGDGSGSTNKPAYSIAYDPTDNTVKLGQGTINATGKFSFNDGEGKAIVVRDTLTDKNLVYWDATKHAIVDSGIKYTDTATHDWVTEQIENNDILHNKDYVHTTGDETIDGVKSFKKTTWANSFKVSTLGATNDPTNTEYARDNITRKSNNLNYVYEYPSVSGVIGIISKQATGSRLALIDTTNNAIGSLANGTNGQVLKLVGGIPTWAADTDTKYTKGSGIKISDSGEISVNTDFATSPSNKNYAVHVDSLTGGLYVNVPWAADTNTWREINIQNASGGSLGNLTSDTTSGAFTLKAGTNVTLTYANGVVTISATDTKYDVFNATTNGLVPAPTVTNATADKYLAGDGTWQKIPTAPTLKVTVQDIPTTATNWVQLSYNGGTYNAVKFDISEAILDVYSAASMSPRIVAPSVIDATSIYFIINEYTEAKIALKVRKITH